MFFDLKSRPRRESGFTMIELLVAVVIIAILAAIAVPVYLNIRDNAARSALKADVNATVKKISIALTGGVGTDPLPLSTIVANSADYIQGTNRGEQIYISPVDGSAISTAAALDTASHFTDGAFVARTALANGTADGVAHARAAAVDPTNPKFFVYGVLDQTKGAPVNYTYDYTSVTDKYTQATSGGAVVNAAPVAPTISTTTLPGAVIGKSYSAPVAGSGTPAPAYTATGLPTGLTMDPATGTISGTTNDPANTYAVVVKSSNPVGVATQNLSLKLTSGAKVAIGSIPVPMVYSNAQYTGPAIPVTDTSTTGTDVFTITGLPTGYTYNTSTGVISGTTTVASNNTITVTVTNGSATNSTTSSFNVLAGAAPSFTTAPTANSTVSATLGTAITPITVTVAGTPAPTLSFTNLPSGISYDSTAGKLIGTPGVVVSNNLVKITAKNAVNPTGVTRSFYLNVAGQLVDTQLFPSSLSFTDTVRFWRGGHPNSMSSGNGSDGYGYDGFGNSLTYSPTGLVVGSSYTLNITTEGVNNVKLTQGAAVTNTSVVDRSSSSTNTPVTITFTATTSSPTFVFGGSRAEVDSVYLYRNS